MTQPKFSKQWRYLAMDEDKCWYVFSIKPIICGKHWVIPKTTLQNPQIENWCELDIYNKIFEPVEDWKKSLIRINK